MSLLDQPERKAFPVAVTRAVCSRTNGRCSCGEIAADRNGVVRGGIWNWKLRPGSVRDHTPPLSFRRVENGVHVPHQHSVDHIQLLCAACNRIKTSQGNGVQRSDAAMIAKLRRAEKQRQGLERPKKKLVSRGFPKKPKPDKFKPIEGST